MRKYLFLISDGVTGCGLYLALNFLLERMIIEKECDVCFAIRAIRKSRPDFITSLVNLIQINSFFLKLSKIRNDIRNISVSGTHGISI